jgi:uncharacterized membrane protein YphA (DoxX/SURF4 family)
MLLLSPRRRASIHTKEFVAPTPPIWPAVVTWIERSISSRTRRPIGGHPRMRPHPLADLDLFLTNTAWPTGAFWAALLASVVVAISNWRRDPEQRTAKHLGRYVLRVLMGLMWWQQALWKTPPNYDGLRFWMQQMVDHAAIQAQSDFVGNVVLPEIAVFGPMLFGVELLIGVLLMLGVFTRLAGFLGALLAINLWLGLYSAPNEWPWTYGFLIVIQVTCIIDPPGRSLGIDAMRRRREKMLAIA